MADIRKSIDFEKTSRVEFAHTGGAPSLDDINVLYSLCKKVPAAEFVWVWKGKKSRKTFTLSACYPVLKDTGWWDYEVLDDPTWRIIDDRDHGNNEIWKQKTCDTELALLCCGMAEHQSDTQEFSFDTEGVNLIQVGHLATPVFAEILEQKRSQKDTHPPKVSVQIIHVVLKSLEQQRYTGKVIVSSNFDIGTIFFNQGVPVHAVVSHTRGDAAIEEIISWQTGAVNHVQDAKTKDMTITRNLDLLISSGFRLLELKRYMSECGIKYESYLFRTGKLDPAKTKGMDDQALKILAHLNRKCTLTDVVRDLELDPPQWAPAISFLANQKLIEVKPVVTERAIALKVARKVPKTGLDNHVTHLRNQKTGLPKFEALLLGIAREYEHFKGSKAPMSLIVFDIKVDDSALKTKWLDDKLTTLIARKIDLIKRPLDLFAHFKLTDYGLFLPNTDAKKAVHVGKRILKSLTNMPLEGRTASLEISLGIAGIPEYGSTVEALVTTAYDAMQHARDTGTSIYVGRVPKKAEESSEPPVDKTLAYRIHHGADPHKARPEQFDLGGLLTAAGIVSEEQWEQVTIISQRTKQPIARVLGLHEIDVSESAGTACEEVMHLINDKKISVDDGLNAVQLICNQGLDLQTALKRFGAAMRVSPLGDLLFNAGVVNDRDLNDALHDSANMDLTLGFLLVARGLVSRGMVHESLDLLELIKARSLSRGDAGQLLKNAHSRSASLKQVLKDSKIDTKAVSSVNIGTLLVLAEVMNDGEFATARELALLSGNRFIDVVLDNGFASQECLSAAEKLLYLVKQGKMELGDAAERLRKGDFETVVEEKSPAASLVEKEKRVVAKQAESVSASAPASVLNSVPEKLVKVAEPKTVPNASPAAQVGGHIETVQPPQTASHSVPPQKQTKPPQSQSVPAQTQTKPPQSQLQSQPQPASSVPPQTQTEDSHKADSLTATPQSQSDLPTEQALPLDPQEPTTPPVPPASSDEEKASEIPLEIAADEEAAKPVTELPQSPKEEPRRPIDRLELLRKARIITEPQLRGAMRTSAEKNASPVRILFDAGIIDQDDLNVTGHVKKMFDAGDIDLRTAINVIRYCKENSVGFDEGLDNVLAQEYP